MFLDVDKCSFSLRETGPVHATHECSRYSKGSFKWLRSFSEKNTPKISTSKILIHIRCVLQTASNITSTDSIHILRIHLLLEGRKWKAEQLKGYLQKKSSNAKWVTSTWFKYAYSPKEFPRKRRSCRKAALQHRRAKQESGNQCGR